MAIQQDIEAAYSRIQSYVLKTPLIKAHAISELVGANVYFKLENIQITGSFKVRGAFNKLLSLNDIQKQGGVVAASSGNFAAAVSYAAKTLGVNADIFVPTVTPNAKLRNIKLYGCEPKCIGDNTGEAERFARQYAEEHHLPYLSPYNDYDVVCGQGTIGVELTEQLDHFDEVYIAVGGGGMIAGIGAYLKHYNKKIKIVGCLPQASPVMYESIKAGKVVECDIQPTLSDGTAGNNDADTITFGFCKEYVDDYALVSEPEIADAIKKVLSHEHMLIEGAAGVALSPLLTCSDTVKNKTVVVVLCGANISMASLKKVIC